MEGEKLAHPATLISLGYEENPPLRRGRTTTPSHKIMGRFDLRWSRRTYIEYNKDVGTVSRRLQSPPATAAITIPILLQFSLKFFAGSKSVGLSGRFVDFHLITRGKLIRLLDSRSKKKEGRKRKERGRRETSPIVERSCYVFKTRSHPLVCS